MMPSQAPTEVTQRNRWSPSRRIIERIIALGALTALSAVTGCRQQIEKMETPQIRERAESPKGNEVPREVKNEMGVFLDKLAEQSSYNTEWIGYEHYKEQLSSGELEEHLRRYFLKRLWEKQNKMELSEWDFFAQGVANGNYTTQLPELGAGDLSIEAILQAALNNPIWSDDLAKIETGELFYEPVDSREWRHDPVYLHGLTDGWDENEEKEEDMAYVLFRLMGEEVSYEWDYLKAGLEKGVHHLNLTSKQLESVDAEKFLALLESGELKGEVAKQWSQLLSKIKSEEITVSEDLKDSALMTWAKEQTAITEREISNPTLRAQLDTLFEALFFGYTHKGMQNHTETRIFRTYREKGADSKELRVRKKGEAREVTLLNLDEEGISSFLSDRTGRWFAYRQHPQRNDDGRIYIMDLDTGEKNKIDAVNPRDFSFSDDGRAFFNAAKPEDLTSEGKADPVDDWIFEYDLSTGQSQPLFQVLNKQEIGRGYKYGNVYFTEDANSQNTEEDRPRYIYRLIGKAGNGSHRAYSISRFKDGMGLSREDFEKTIYLPGHHYSWKIIAGDVYITLDEHTVYKKAWKDFASVESVEELRDWEVFLKIESSSGERLASEGRSAYSIPSSTLFLKDGYYLYKIANERGKSYYRVQKKEADGRLGEPMNLFVNKITWDSNDPDQIVHVWPQENIINPDDRKGEFKQFKHLDEVIAAYKDKKAEMERDGIAYKNEVAVTPEGVRIPMTLVGPSEVISGEKTAKATLYYVYGGFGNKSAAQYDQRFQMYAYLMAKAGVLFVRINPRGDYGREEGAAWHKDGILANKKNAFSDTAFAMKWTQDNGYATPKNAILAGASNGGVVTAATALDHSEFLSTAIPTAGILDLERFDQFNPSKGYWGREYGDPKNPEHAGFIAENSPLQKISPHETCRFIIQAGLLDDRVSPLHSLVFAIKLMEANTNNQVHLRLRDQAHSSNGRRDLKGVFLDKVALELSVLGVETVDAKIPE